MKCLLVTRDKEQNTPTQTMQLECCPGKSKKIIRSEVRAEVWKVTGGFARCRFRPMQFRPILERIRPMCEVLSPDTIIRPRTLQYNFVLFSYVLCACFCFRNQSQGIRCFALNRSRSVKWFRPKCKQLSINSLLYCMYTSSDIIVNILSPSHIVNVPTF